MAYFTHMFTFVGAPFVHMSGISDMTIYRIGAIDYLFTGADADGGMNSFMLAENQIAAHVEQIGYGANRGTLGLNDIDLVNVNSQALLLPAGRYDDRTAFHEIGVNGSFDGVKTLGADPAKIGGFTNVIGLEVSGKTFMVASQLAQDGFHSYRIR